MIKKALAQLQFLKRNPNEQLAVKYSRNGAGFTLIEVLVASGVLFIVSSAVVGLSNSIIQGTSKNADVTVTNRWATEGLELTSKIRTDSLKAGGTIVAGEKVWFAPAADWQTAYGWYKLEEQTLNGVTNWELKPINGQNTVSLAMNSLAPTHLSPTDKLVSQELEAYRLICIEAYGATALEADNGYVDCNRSPGSNPATADPDGDRSIVTSCQPKDLFCNSTLNSLNLNTKNLPDRIIPPGNAVKVRSVVVWQDRTTYQSVDVATVFTNWKGTEQN